MKKMKYKNVNGKLVPIVEMEEQITIKTDDKELQFAFDTYNKLFKRCKGLNKRAKAIFDLTEKISETNTLYTVNLWYQILDKLDAERANIYKYKCILQDISEYFTNGLDVMDAAFEDKKQLFIYAVNMYEKELIVYKTIVIAAEKYKAKLNLNITPPDNPKTR